VNYCDTFSLRLYKPSQEEGEEDFCKAGKTRTRKETFPFSSHFLSLLWVVFTRGKRIPRGFFPLRFASLEASRQVHKSRGRRKDFGRSPNEKEEKFYDDRRKKGMNVTNEDAEFGGKEEDGKYPFPLGRSTPPSWSSSTSPRTTSFLSSLPSL
jgi:hypothetical protein